MEEPRRLGGRYELGHVLGRGGMAEVHLAHDTRLGRTVAVKTLRVDLARDPSFQARFRREAQSAASLNHPAIVAVYDTGEDYIDGVSIPYIVMEYVDGSTLRELLHSGRKLLPERAMEMTIGILQGLEYAHRNGIVHRDIKPGNLLITPEGRVKITDFGVSYSTNQEQITQDGMVVGTAQYISPEQAQGKHATPQSDIYSLGVVAYEGLCGHRPFTGATPVDIAAAHVNNPVPPLPDTVDVQLREFVMSMLAKDPLDRPKDALVVSRTLSRIERRLLDQQTQLADTMVVSSGGRLPRRVVSKPHISVSNDWKEQG